MRIERKHLGHYGAEARHGAGFDLWPHDSGDGVFMLAFFPGPLWLEGGEAQYNPLTRATELNLGWRDAFGEMHRCGTVRLTAGPDGAMVAAFNITDGPSGIGSFTDTFARLVGGSAPPPVLPPLHPQPPEPEPPAPPIEPLPPVIPPALGALNPHVYTWAQLFGGELGQPGAGWDLNPPMRLNNGDILVDVACIAFRAPSGADGFTYGRFTQNPDGGSITHWISTAPGDIEFAQATPGAWIAGDLTWELQGSNHPQGRIELIPGAIYYLNAAFLDAQALFTEGRVSKQGAGGEWMLTATQNS
jgi:hypothetical protein